MDKKIGIADIGLTSGNPEKKNSYGERQDKAKTHLYHFRFPHNKESVKYEA